MNTADRFHSNLSLKTKALNFFRKPFTAPLLEKILLGMVLKNPPHFLKKVFPEYYLYKKGTLRYAARQGINYKLDVSNYLDHYIYWGVADSGYTSILREMKTADVMLDIGAHIGESALFYASINSRARIFAFEPHPVSFRRARVNILLNRFQNIHLINLGLGERAEILKLYEVNENNSGANRIMRGENNFPYKEIAADTLDNLMQERMITKVDFIKIDVEGFEFAVLKGGAETIIQSKPVMFIELDDNNLKENNSCAEEIIELLRSFGYNRIYRADNLMPIISRQEFSGCHYGIIAK